MVPPPPPRSNFTFDLSKPFNAILDERQRTFMSRELVVLRDAILAQKIDFAHISEYGHHGTTDPKGGLKTMLNLFNQMSLYIMEASWGQAALIRKGLIPPVPKLRTKTSIMGAVKATSADDAQSRKFIKVFDEWLVDMRYPDDDLLRRLPESFMTQCIARCEPLSPELQREAEDVNTLPSLALMEEFRRQGAMIRLSAVKPLYDKGDELFQMALKLKGKDREFAIMKSEEIWILSAMCGPLCDSGYGKMARSALEKKNWYSAIDMAEMSLIWLKHRQSDPKTFAEKRINTLHQFVHGVYAPNLDVGVRVTPEESLEGLKTAHRLIALSWDMGCREHLEKLNGEASEDLAERLFEDAISAYLTWYNLDTSNKVPLKKIEALKETKKTKFQHAKSLASASAAFAQMWGSGRTTF